MKKLKIALAGLILLSGMTILSCKKNSDNTTTDSDVSGASDNALAENTSNDIISIGSQATDKSNGGLSSFKTGAPDNEMLTSCATVTRDSVAKTVTVTFNNSTCLDGRTRNGSLVFNYSTSTNGAKHYRDPGFSFTVTSNNYTVDGNQVNILNKTVTNTTAVGFNPATTNETWSISANISIIKASGATVTWTCTRIKTLLNTSTTYTGPNVPIDWPNARIGITGTATGTRANGETFTSTVTSQLVRDFGACSIGGKHPFIQGSLSYAPGSKPVRYIDYGSGTCDLNATVTINGIVYNITLP